MEQFIRLPLGLKFGQDVFVYRSGVRNGEMAFASAIALYQSIFGFLLVVTANRIAGKFDKETTLF